MLLGFWLGLLPFLPLPALSGFLHPFLSFPVPLRLSEAKAWTADMERDTGGPKRKGRRACCGVSCEMGYMVVYMLCRYVVYSWQTSLAEVHRDSHVIVCHAQYRSTLHVHGQACLRGVVVGVGIGVHDMIYFGPRIPSPASLKCSSLPYMCECRESMEQRMLTLRPIMSMQIRNAC